MFIKRLFAFLFRPGAARLRESREAAGLLADTRVNLNARQRALEATQNATSANARQRQAEVVQQVITAYEQAAVSTDGLFSPRINRLIARLKQLVARTAPERLDVVERDTEVELVEFDARFEPQLVEARRTERSRWWSLRTFQIEHYLGNEAKYPASLVLHFGALAFVWLIESIANCWAFAQGSSLGLLGGLLQAMLVAAVNLVFAFYAGRAASGLYHRRWRIKSVALFLVGTWVAFEVLFALTVAHYRIALMANVDTAPWMAIERLLTMPFVIDDVTSVLLTLFTAAFGVAALLTGLATDDRYPGYGARDRAHKQADAYVASLRTHRLDKIMAIFAAALKTIRTMAARLDGIWTSYSETNNDLKSARTALSHGMDEIDVACREDLFIVHKTFSEVGFAVGPAEVPEKLTASPLLAQAGGAITEAETLLDEVPLRVARFEQQCSVVEARLRQREAKRLEAAPAFCTRVEALAEAAVEEDDNDVVRAMERQRSLFEEARHIERRKTRDSGSASKDDDKAA